jgi:hypothetical protein
MNRAGHRWTLENISRLGKEPDRAIAVSLGITASSVGYQRRSLGIPALSTLIGRSGWLAAFFFDQLINLFLDEAIELLRGLL